MDHINMEQKECQAKLDAFSLLHSAGIEYVLGSSVFVISGGAGSTSVGIMRNISDDSFVFTK